MLLRCTEVETKNDCINNQWVDYAYISPHFVMSLIAAEDQRFFEHNGFDLEAIEQALEYNRKGKGKRKRGASTISQQVAKNVFLWPSRSWVRKGFEVYFTSLVEMFWSKKRIIEVYSNVIELGHGVYGVEAAAQEYFDKTGMKMNKSQAACLAAVLPNPRKFSVRSPTAYMRKRQQWIMRQVNNLGGTGFLDKQKSLFSGM